MRKLIIAAVAVVVLAGGAAGGWWGYHHLFRDRLKEATALLAAGKVQAAALELRELVQDEPNNAEAQVRLGAVQLLLGDPVAAEKNLLAGQAAGYKKPDLNPLLARALLGQRRDKELLAKFTPDGLPTNYAAEVLVTRGLAQLSLADPVAAGASADAAERLDPKLAAAQLLAARAAVAQNQPGFAIANLDRAIALNPKLTEALLLKAGILRAQTRQDEAMPVLDQAVAVAATPGEIGSARMSRAGALLAAGEDAKALADLQVVLQMFPKSPGGNYLKVLALTRTKDWRAADTTLQTIQPLLPRLPRGEYYLALVKSNVNQMEQASDAIEHYTARVPGDADGWRLQARIDLLAGRKDAAAQALAKLPLIPLKPSQEADAAAQAETPQELTQLASLQIGSGDTSAAANDLERSIDTLPTPGDVAARAITAALRVGDIDRAAHVLETLQRDPKVSEERMATLTGAVRLAQLDLDGARAAFAAGLKAVPVSAPLKLDLARVLLLQGHPADAQALIAPTLAAAPASRTALEMMLDIYSVTGQPDRARAAVAAARDADPHSAALLLTQVALQMRAGDTAGALAALEQAPAELTRQAPVMAMHVRLLLAQKKLKEAILAQRQLLQELPNNKTVRRDLIDMLVADKQGEAAVQVAREGLQSSPGNGLLQQAYLEAVLKISGEDAALKLAETLRADPANLPYSELLKGAVYLAAGHPADAAAAFGAERAKAPFTALVINEAMALRAVGETDKARSLLTDWTTKAADPAASDALASIEISTKRYDAAVAALNDVLAIRPDDPVALNNLAWVYQQQKNPKAVDYARRAYLVAPGGQTADTLGWILTQQGNPTLGLLLLRQAAARLPQDPSVLYHLAAALDSTGDDAHAGAVLNVLVASKVKFDEADAAQALQQKLAAGAPTAGQTTPAAAPAATTAQ